MAPVARDGDALVVFHDDGVHWLGALLRKGFKHVFVAVVQGGYWVKFDPLAGVPLIEVQANADYDMEAYFRSMGYQVVWTRINREAPVLGPFFMANCVGAVKAVIGLRARFVFTPHQLYRRLRKC